MWLEGLTKDTDFKFSVVYKNSSGQIADRDDVHMLIAEWTLIGADGNENTDGVGNILKDDLLGSANSDPEAAPVQDREKFKFRIDGAPANVLGTITVRSDDEPSDYYEDSLVNSGNVLVSESFGVIYSTSDGQSLLSTSDKSAIKAALGVHTVHNGAATATTSGANPQTRPVKLNAKQTLMARLQEEENKHRNYVYYSGVTGNSLTGLQAMFAAHTNALIAMTNVGFATTPAEITELGTNVAITTSANRILMKPSLPAVTAVHELVHVRQFAGQWNNNGSDPTHDEAEAWILEKMLGTTIFLRKLEDAIGAKDAALIKSSWSAAWNATNGFPSIIGSLAPAPGTGGAGGRPVTASDVWDVNNSALDASGKPHLGVRFSASNLGMIYNQMIAAKGIIDPATGSTLVLTAPPPATPPGPFD